MQAVLAAALLMPCAAFADGATSDTVLDEPIERIADTPSGCAVLDKDFPGMRAHPMYGYFKSMSLNQVAAMSKGQITPDMLAQAKSDLSAAAGAATAAVTTTTATASATATTAPVEATPVSIQP
jgi:hypothetical protein